MSKFERFASNATWEPLFGYSRAVRAGEWLAVSGTTATDERGMPVGVGQMYVQARQALLNIKAAVERAGLSVTDVVRTRVFVTDMLRFAEVARAHREMFGDTLPASTVVEVRRLVHPSMMVEIEADAYAGPQSAHGEAELKTASPNPRRAASQGKPRRGAAGKRLRAKPTGCK
jgi:enamine deaminase RidA (YjgF/YER057c/UK114 family)